MTSQLRAETPPVEQVAITLAPMRRRHLRTVLAIERKVYPKPWTMGLFLGELSRPESRSYVVARSGAVVVGHAGPPPSRAGLCFARAGWVRPRSGRAGGPCPRT